MTQVTFSLSDTVAAQAQEAGLLTQECIEELLQEAVRRQAAGRFLEMSKRMQAAAAAEGLEPMSMEEIQEEVRAVRAERRARAAAQ